MPIISVQTENKAEKRTLLFHCAGEIYGKTLGESLEPEKNIPIIEHNEFFVEISGKIVETDLQFTEAEILRLLFRRWKSFESAFDFGRFQTDLPTKVRRDSVFEAFDSNEFFRLCQNANFSKNGE